MKEKKVINIRIDVIKRLQGLGNRITDTDAVRKVFQERKDHFQFYKGSDAKKIWKEARAEIADWLSRQIEKINKK